MFEKASISQVLEIRSELSPYLGAFREAVVSAAATIESASWNVGEFAQEAELVFQENIKPAVDRIEDRVKGDRELKELTYRYGPSLLGGVSSIGAFIGSGSALAALAALAAGLQAAATVETSVWRSRARSSTSITALEEYLAESARAPRTEL